jgi:hypothetical protein
MPGKICKPAVFFILGDALASESYVPIFRSTLYEDGTERSEMSAQNSESWESPKRRNTTFRIRRKFEKKNMYACQDSSYSGQNLNQELPEYKPVTLQIAPFAGLMFKQLRKLLNTLTSDVTQLNISYAQRQLFCCT